MNVGALLDRYEALLKQRAPLWALYGAFGTFEHTRKVLLSTCRDSYRLAMHDANTRVTEGALEDMARTHPEYQALIQRATQERGEMALLDAEIETLGHRISYLRAKTYENAQLARMQ